MDDQLPEIHISVAVRLIHITPAIHITYFHYLIMPSLITRVFALKINKNDTLTSQWNVAVSIAACYKPCVPPLLPLRFWPTENTLTK